MDEPASHLIVTPTELDRSDGFFDLFVLLGSGLAVWWLVLQGVPWLPLVPPLVLIALWMLSGTPAADVPYLGALAAGVHNVFGMRRIHEWAQALAHFWRVAILPVWRAQCAQFLTSSRNRIMRWRMTLSAWTRRQHWRVRSWGSAIRFRFAARLAK